MKNRNRIITGVLIACMGLILSGCSTEEAMVKVPEVKNVKAVPVKVETIGTSVLYAGKLKPITEITVSPKIAGKVEAMKVETGMQVAKGDVLFSLEKKEAEAQYNQARAALDSARASYVRNSDSAIEQQVIQAEQAVKQTQVAREDAKRVYDRILELYKTNAASQQDVDTAETRWKNAEVQWEGAKSNLELLNTKTGPQTVNAASSQVDQAEAALRLAQVQMENVTVTAPVSGIISRRNVEEGEIVAAGTPAIVIISTGEMIAEVSLPDNMLGKVVKGQKVNVTVTGAGNQGSQGIVDSVNTVPDSKNQLYTVKVKVNNDSGVLKSGMLAKVEFPLEKKEQVLAVPNEALIAEGGLYYVYTVTEDGIRKVPVTTGISDGSMTEVSGSIKQGDLLVREGQNFLMEGQKVNVVSGK